MEGLRFPEYEDTGSVLLEKTLSTFERQTRRHEEGGLGSSRPLSTGYGQIGIG